MGGYDDAATVPAQSNTTAARRGTVVDWGSHAPMGAFVQLFASQGVAITIDEARVPMGLPKWHHIQALGRQPRIAAAWQAAHGAPWIVCTRCSRP
jgi:hypothetical protein